MRPAPFLIAVFLSGGAGLMYQTVWIRKLGFIFGNTTLSVSIVLSSFFFGLAAGSYWFGKRADKCKSPVRLYRNLELGIAVAAIFVMLALPLLNDLYVVLYRSLFGRSLLLVSVAKFVLTFVLLSIPTFLMGGTLPVMTKCFVRSKETFAVSLGIIYGINTIGAVFGLVVMAFVLIEVLGLQNSYAVSLFFSLLSAAFASLSYRGDSAVRASNDAEAEVATIQPRAKSLYLLSFLSGAISLGYEVLWIRLWSFINLHSSKSDIGYPPTELSSTYVYSGILGLFLIGISIGGVLVKWIRNTDVHPLRQLAYVQGLIGLYTLVTIIIERTLLLDGLATKMVEIGLIVLPTTILMGIGFPLLASAFVDTLETAGNQFGLFYAMNTLGSAVGPLLVGLVFIPLKGTYSCLAFLGILNLLVGALLYVHTVRERRTAQGTLKLVGLIGGLALVLILVFPFKVFIPRHGSIDFKVIFEEDNHVGHTLVLEYANGIKDVAVNNYAVSSIDPNHTFGNLTMQIPVSLLGRVPEDILVLCVGSGGSWVSTLRYENANVTAVDINPAAFRCMPYIHPASIMERLKEPRMRPVVTDARNYLLLDDRKYDIINIDPAPPITQPGMVNLHTREFYSLARNRLKPGGILYQRLSANVESELLYKTLLRSIADEFKDVTVWRFLHSGVDIIASDRMLDALHYDEELITSQMYRRAHLYFEFGRKEVDAYTADVPAVTDDRPILEYHLLERSGIRSKFNTRWTGPEHSRDELVKLKRPMADYIKTEQVETDAP